jgi:hypothetical protein
MKKEKVRAGRPWTFGHRLNESVVVLMGSVELKAVEDMASELDLSTSRLIYQILFGISKPINLKQGGKE